MSSALYPWSHFVEFLKQRDEYENQGYFKKIMVVHHFDTGDDPLHHRRDRIDPCRTPRTHDRQRRNRLENGQRQHQERKILIEIPSIKSMRRVDSQLHAFLF